MVRIEYIDRDTAEAFDHETTFTDDVLHAAIQWAQFMADSGVPVLLGPEGRRVRFLEVEMSMCDFKADLITVYVEDVD